MLSARLAIPFLFFGGRRGGAGAGAGGVCVCVRAWFFLSFFLERESAIGRRFRMPGAASPCVTLLYRCVCVCYVAFVQL